MSTVYIWVHQSSSYYIITLQIIYSPGYVVLRDFFYFVSIVLFSRQFYCTLRNCLYLTSDLQLHVA